MSSNPAHTSWRKERDSRFALFGKQCPNSKPGLDPKKIRANLCYIHLQGFWLAALILSQSEWSKIRKSWINAENVFIGLALCLVVDTSVFECLVSFLLSFLKLDQEEFNFWKNFDLFNSKSCFVVVPKLEKFWLWKCQAHPSVHISGLMNFASFRKN